MIAEYQQSALECSVLVLNKHYMALRVVSARRAFSLLCRELAEVISFEDGRYTNYDFDTWCEVSQAARTFTPDAHDWISTVHFEIAVPRIIRLLIYDRLPRTEVKFNRRNIYARDESKCQYCGKRFPTSELTLDHVVPRSRGGSSTWDNLVCCCVACNMRKGGRLPEQAGLKLIRRPYKPKRSPLIRLTIRDHRYRSWRHFVDEAYWSVELK